MFIKSLALIAIIALNTFNLNAGPAARVYSIADTTNRLTSIITNLQAFAAATPVTKAASLSNIAIELRAVAVGPLASNIVTIQMQAKVAVAKYKAANDYGSLVVDSPEYIEKDMKVTYLRLQAKESLEKMMNLRWIQSVLFTEASTLEIVSLNGVESFGYLNTIESLAISRNMPEGKELIDREVNNMKFFINRAAGVIGNAIVGIDCVRPLSPKPL